MKRGLILLGALAVVGCSGPSVTKTPAQPSAKPTLITRAATPYGEVELAAIVRVSDDDVQLFAPEGSAYTGEMPDRFSLDCLTMIQDISNKPASGFCFRLPQEFPIAENGLEVFLDGKSASYYRLGPRLDGAEPGRFAFALVDGNFDGRAMTVRFALKPERMVAKGSWPIEGTISIADTGRLSTSTPENENEEFAVSLDLDEARPDKHYGLVVFDVDGNRIKVSGSGGRGENGYLVSYWWQVRGADSGKRFEIWEGGAVSVEFSGVAL